jgi:hypothetical protein
MALDGGSTMTIYGDITAAIKEEFEDDSLIAKFVPCAAGCCCYCVLVRVWSALYLV